MAAAGVTAAASEEAAAATSQPALPADRCCRIRCLSGFALAADLILCAEDSARYRVIGQMWAGLDSNQRRRKASRFTVCPVWPLRYLPVLARGISYILAPCSLQLPLAFAAVDSTDVTVTFRHGASARPFWFALFLVLTFCFVVLFEYGPRDFASGAQKEYARVKSFVVKRTEEIGENKKDR